MFISLYKVVFLVTICNFVNSMVLFVLAFLSDQYYYYYIDNIQAESLHTMNMADKERGQNIQFLILPSTIAVVDKGTSLHCYYVKMCRTGEYACDTCSTHFYIIAVKGCSFVYLRNCIFCPLSLSVIFTSDRKSW